MEIKLIGYIAGDTFGSRGNSHFANLDGNVVCGTKNRFGMDCSYEIRFVSEVEFYLDQWKSFKEEDKFNLRKGHLPLDCFITCKKCQSALAKILNKNNVA